MYKLILGMRVDITSTLKAVAQISRWVDQKKGRYVCVSNVHMCMESFDDDLFQAVVNNADLVVPDGRPLVWGQKLLSVNNAQQARGMDLMLSLCEHAEISGISIGLYGGMSELLDKLKDILTKRFPELQIACVIAPPFRKVSEDENDKYIDLINRTEVGILFVGLGCPKQEKWMAKNRKKVNCVMLGVGAAFDFIAGEKRHAPIWMQSIGLEWLFRLLSEPRRLWKRYLKHNPRFVFYFLCQLLGKKYD